MSLNPKIEKGVAVLALFFMVSCASPPLTRVLTPVEQIAADSERAAGLVEDFKKKAKWVQVPRLERFLTRIGQKISTASRDFPLERVEVRIHHDSTPDLKRAFSFPGTLVSIPLGFLREVEFENELGALIAYELAHVINRHLATRVFSAEKSDQVSFVLFGDASVFDLDRDQRSRSIKVGTELLYFSGYDVRGMASMFQREARFFGNPDTESSKKEVDFNVREAQRARSGLLPSLKPVVRSSEFIQFKRELDRIR